MVKNVFYFMLKSSFRSWGIYIFSWPFDDAEKWLDKNAMVKVASRVQKIEVFEKGWNFAICFCFASCIMKKYYFFHRGKKRCFFSLFSLWSYLLLCWAIWMRIQLSRRTPRSETIFGNWKPFKNDGKCFLFYLKYSFRSQDI